MEEQILIRITGQDRPGLTTAVMSILACYNAHILDIGQADIHSTLSLGILIRIDDQGAGQGNERTVIQGYGTWCKYRFCSCNR